MKFSSLFRKLGKQPLSVTQKMMFVLDYEYMRDLLKEKKCCYKIPLELNCGNGKQKL